MEPQRASQATLDDLVGRVLDKGVVLKLDLIVGIAGIPLIGITLQAAVGAIETMLDYGMMEAWDADTRGYAKREAERRQGVLQPGEHVLLEQYGSYHHARGISRVWRPGRLILTDQRLLLVRQAPSEVLFGTRVSAIAGLGRVMHENGEGGRREIVCLALADGTLAALYTPQPDILEAGLRQELQRLGQVVAEISAAPIGRLDPGAVAEGQLWHCRVPDDGPALWKSGWAVLTETALTWRPDMGPHQVVRVPLAKIWGLAVERRELGTPGAREVLVVTHEVDGQRGEALFTGKRIDAWLAAIRQAGLTGDEDGDARS